ncbi:unnamed protein product [Gadus morhua 'NCC']
MKDRLAQLKEKSDPGEEVEIPVENQAFMDDFFAQIEDIRGSIDKIDTSVADIKKLYSTILSAPTSEKKTQDDLEALTNEIKKSANNARNKLKTIEKQLETNTDERASADLRIRKSQHAILAKKFVEVMTKYNEAQMDFRDKSKGRIARQLEISESGLVWFPCLSHSTSSWRSVSLGWSESLEPLYLQVENSPLAAIAELLLPPPGSIMLTYSPAQLFGIFNYSLPSSISVMKQLGLLRRRCYIHRSSRRGFVLSQHGLCIPFTLSPARSVTPLTRHQDSPGR